MGRGFFRINYPAIDQSIIMHYFLQLLNDTVVYADHAKPFLFGGFADNCFLEFYYNNPRRFFNVC